MDDFGKWLQGELNERGLTPTRFARSIGVSHASVSRWLSGERRPKRMHAYRVAKALEISPMTMQRWGYELTDNYGEPILLSSDNEIYEICDFLRRNPEFVPVFLGFAKALMNVKLDSYQLASQRKKASESNPRGTLI